METKTKAPIPTIPRINTFIGTRLKTNTSPLNKIKSCRLKIGRSIKYYDGKKLGATRGKITSS